MSANSTFVYVSINTRKMYENDSRFTNTEKMLRKLKLFNYQN